MEACLVKLEQEGLERLERVADVKDLARGTGQLGMAVHHLAHEQGMCVKIGSARHRWLPPSSELFDRRNASACSSVG